MYFEDTIYNSIEQPIDEASLGEKILITALAGLAAVLILKDPVSQAYKNNKDFKGMKTYIANNMDLINAGLKYYEENYDDPKNFKDINPVLCTAKQMYAYNPNVANIGPEWKNSLFVIFADADKGKLPFLYIVMCDKNKTKLRTFSNSNYEISEDGHRYLIAKASLLLDFASASLGKIIDKGEEILG